MYQQREKLQQISKASLLASVLSLLTGFFTSILIFLYFAALSLSLAISTEGILLQFSHLKQASIRLLSAGIILFLITIFLFIRYLKGL